MAENAESMPQMGVDLSAENVGIGEIEDLERSSSVIIERLREIVFAPDKKKRLNRRWSITQAADLLDRTPKTIRQYEKDGRLPAPTLSESRRRVGYTLQELNHMRRVFGIEPFRSEEDEPVVLAVQNFKGGVGKSTISSHVAQYLAIKGYRVLLIDADPQASTTSIFGLHPDIDVGENETAYEFLTGYEASLRYAVRHTHFDQLDLVPANLALYSVEYEMAARLPKTPELLNRLRQGVRGAAQQYDVVVIDPPPALGMLSLSVLRAANAMIIPVRPSAIDFSSTVSFFRMLADAMRELDKRGMPAAYKFLQLLSNDLDEGKSAHQELNRLMGASYGKQMISTALRDSAEIDNAAAQLQTVYELDAPITSRGTRERCLRYLDRVCGDVELLIRRTWPSHRRRLRDLGLV